LPPPITILGALNPPWTAVRLLISNSHRSIAGVASSSLPALPLIVVMAKFTHVKVRMSAMEYSPARNAASPSLRYVQRPDGFGGETTDCRGRLVLGRDEAQERAKGGPYPAHRPEERGHRLFAAASRFRQHHSPRATQGSRPTRRLSLGHPRRRGRRSPVSFH
jgi:hypothetical protein